MTTKNNRFRIAAINTAQKVMQDQEDGVIAVNRDYVQLSDELFFELFRGQPIETQTRTNDAHFPFRYVAYSCGTQFITVSEKTLESFYPVEQLAQDLLWQWEESEFKDKLAVLYVNGSYILGILYKFLEGTPVVYSYEQYMNEESVTLEQAILDHMEGVHSNDSI